MTLTWADMKPGTSMCVVCGHLHQRFSDHHIEEAANFGCCGFANWRCPTLDGWMYGHADHENPHGHELPAHWVKADMPADSSAAVAEHFARHEAEGTAAPFLKKLSVSARALHAPSGGSRRSRVDDAQ